MSNIFQSRKELKFGKVIEVSGSTLRIEIDENVNELIRVVDGQVYPVGQVGSILKVHFGRTLLFAFVRSLKMRSDLVSESTNQFINASDDARILEADLFGQGIWSNKNSRLEFSRGVEAYPLPLQSVYICLNDELEAVYNAAESNAQDEAITPMVPIGNYIGGNNAICRANIDKLFGHHFAILGSTGSGKSATVASILHSVLNHSPGGNQLKPRIVMIDPHGEYANAFGERAKVYRAYSDASVATDKAEILKLPYWLMSSDELRSLIIGKTEYEATSQNNIIYEAITYSRLLEAGYIKDVGAEPKGGVNAALSEGVTEAQILNFDRDKPVPFELTQFVKHIDKVQGSKEGTRDRLAASSGRDKIDTILKKLKVLRSNPQLDFLLREYNKADSPKLHNILAQFVGDANEQDVRIIDISGLPNEVAGPLTALISRLLFQYKLWQTRDEREKNPVLLICEEAHRYVPNQGEAQYKEAQDAIRRIAKEGRKYGLGLGLVSQRPSDVESTVLSQCNSWIVLRLSNSSDQEHVSRFLPDSLSGLTKMLSALTRREAIFVGEAAALPSRIRIRELLPKELPNSNDIKFASGWSKDATQDTDLTAVANRWCGTAIEEQVDVTTHGVE